MKNYETILINLDSSLDFLESEKEETLEKAEEGILIVKRALEQLRDCVIKRKFKNNNDEISFFKQIKPQVFSKLIYYQKLFNIESKKPRSSNKLQIKYFNISNRLTIRLTPKYLICESIYFTA